jgi:hypothetical protein
LFRLRENTTTNKWEGREITTCGPEMCVPPLTGIYEPYIISFGEDESGKVLFFRTSLDVTIYFLDISLNTV